MIVYDIGTYPAKERTGRNIYPGYIVIMNTDELKSYSSQGMVHGKLCKDIFGEEPSTMIKKYGAMMSGFAIKEGELIFNSFTLNTGGEHQNNKKAMHETE